MKIKRGKLSNECTNVVFAGAVSLALAVSGAARAQEPPEPVESVVEAARNAREHVSSDAAHPKVITNDDLGVPPSLQSPSAKTSASPSATPAEVSTTRPAGCSDPEGDERLKQELQATQEELDQIRGELSYDPTVISDGDVDLKNFKPGSSGLAFGSPPLSQSQPQAPARVTEVMLEQKITAIKAASRIACDTPKNAAMQSKLDAGEQQLSLLKNEFALDQAAYYSKPDYANDTAGKAKLDAEQQQVQSLESELEQLKDELVNGEDELD